MSEIIKNHVPLDELLAGLAEECSELSQAALKLRRVFTQVNPTPKAEDEAIDDLYEEIADVELYLSMITINRKYIKETMQRKLQRWESRINEQSNADSK